MNNRVVVGMSGGVDSSVAACLLLERGYEVIGITMQMCPENPDRLPTQNGPLSAADDAGRVAGCLDIPYHVFSSNDDFRKYVIDYFAYEYALGRTPNPCIACNRYVKWGALLSKAKQFGAGYLATGHYARISAHPGTGRLCVSCSAAPGKDQSYALCSLTQEQIAVTLLPVGDYRKEDVRKIAIKYKLPVADKPDSQDICFVPDGDYARFIMEQKNITAPGGHFVDETGNILGKHKGIIHYTVGQRKGLGLALGRRMYVKSINAVNNTVTLSEDISVSEMTVNNINWMAFEPFEGERRLYVKIRYNHTAAGCSAYIERSLSAPKIRCRFDAPQWAVTPGQSAVFYDRGYIAFSGVIDNP